MKVLFLSISTAVSNLNNRGIYPDLLRYIAKQGHEVYIVCPFERRTKKKTKLLVSQNVHILGVWTLNITKSNPVEKLLATLLIQRQFQVAIEKYFCEIQFDLILYATPPITFNSLIKKIKSKYKAKTYLMLKDIFPQNAIDLGMMRKNGFLHKYFKRKEEKLYEISDFIGCMSPANVEYLLKQNESISKDKVIICPNAIDVKERNSFQLETLNKYDIPSDKTIFLYAGNLGVGQGIEFLIECLEECKYIEDSFFLIIGSGNKADLLKKWILIHKPKNVKFINFLPKDEFDKLEECCDVGLVFLDYRFTIPNFPSRVLSYMESSIPIIVCSDEVSDLGPIVVKNEFGVYCKSNDSISFNKAISLFCTNKSLINSMGVKSKKYLEDNFTVQLAYKSIFDNI